MDATLINVAGQAAPIELCELCESPVSTGNDESRQIQRELGVVVCANERIACIQQNKPEDQWSACNEDRQYEGDKRTSALTNQRGYRFSMREAEPYEHQRAGYDGIQKVVVIAQQNQEKSDP